MLVKSKKHGIPRQGRFWYALETCCDSFMASILFGRPPLRTASNRKRLSCSKCKLTIINVPVLNFRTGGISWRIGSSFPEFSSEDEDSSIIHVGHDLHKVLINTDPHKSASGYEPIHVEFIGASRS